VVTAAGAGVPEGWTLQSVHITMLGPVPAGEVACVTTDLKRGSSLLVRSVELLNPGGSPLTTASVVFGAARAQTSASAAPVPRADPAPVADAEVVALGAPLAPEFTGRLTFRPVRGFPYSGQAESLTCGWIGMPKGEEDTLTPAVVAALADAWWIAAIVGLGPDDLRDGPPPVATVGFSLSFPQAPEPGQTVGDEGLWHIGEVLGGHDGYLTEQRRLYDAAGRLLALNTQLVALGGTAK